MRTAGTAGDLDRRSAYVAWTVVLALIVIGLPLFLRMPVWCDVTHYDLCARNSLRGGVHYRDVFDTNLPGMVWLHVLVRSTLGWSSEAIRAVDAAVVATIIVLLLKYLRSEGHNANKRAWTAAALCGFYLFTSEFCHVQRDVWMLLPALAALMLHRRRWIGRRSMGDAPPTFSLAAFVEGAAWAAGCWIKPFVAVPALACWLVSGLDLLRTGRTRELLRDGGATLLGGLVVGLAGGVWMVSSGSWPYFWETIASWNREYFDFANRNWLWPIKEFKVWLAVHLIAVPVAISHVCRLAHSEAKRKQAEVAGVLLAAFYLSWLFQAAFLQHGFVYHHAPPIFLAITVVAAWRFSWRRSRIGLLVLGLFGVIVICQHPLAKWDRSSLWPRCFASRKDSALKDRLALWDMTDWENLDRVAAFLRTREIPNKGLTCFATFTSPLYLELDLEPSTRYTQLHSLAYYFFPERRRQIFRELSESPQRYLVTDVGPGFPLLDAEQSLAEVPGSPLALPPAFPPEVAGHYPWNEPIVFRAGRYYVHRVTGRVTDVRVGWESHKRVELSAK